MRRLAWSLLLCIAALPLLPAGKAPPAQGQGAPVQAPELPGITRLPTINDALALCVADLRTLPPLDQPFMWYVFITPDAGDASTLQRIAQAMSAAINAWSRGTVIVRPLPLGKDRLLVLRLNLKDYAPQDTDIIDLLALREEFQFEPRLNLLLTKDTLGIASIRGELPTKKVKKAAPKKAKVKVKGTEEESQQEADTELAQAPKKKSKAKIAEVVEPPVVPDVVIEDEFENVPITAADLEKVDVFRVVGRTINQAALQELQNRTASLAPMVTHSYFLRRSLTTIQTDLAAPETSTLFKTLYGGLYYELAGIKENKTGQGTDEDLWFQDHVGLGNIKGGLTAAAFYETRRSDQRAAIRRSAITGEPRSFDYGHGPLSRDSQGIWAVTHDRGNNNIDIGTDPIINLLNAKDKAREGLWDRGNGMVGTVLFNAAGKLQREVPIDIAVNREIPSPHPPRLEPFMGCLSCHFIKSEGWHGFSNDVKTMLDGGFNIFGDRSSNQTSNSTLDRLRGLYTGSPDKLLRRARDDHAEAMLKATGPWPGRGAQADVVKVTSETIWNLYVGHVYDQVDARKALAELGFELTNPDPDPKKAQAEAVKVLRSMLPPERDAAIGSVILEDPRIGALLLGMSINRVDFDLVYSFAAARIAKTLAGAKK